MIKEILYLILAVGKAIWSSVISIVWGFAGFFILMGVVKQYDQSLPLELIASIRLLMDNWQWFFLIIFVIDAYLVYKELKNETK